MTYVLEANLQSIITQKRILKTSGLPNQILAANGDTPWHQVNPSSLDSYKTVPKGQVTSALLAAFQNLAVSLSASSSSEDMIPGPLPESLAVAYCCQAYNDAIKAAMERGERGFTKAGKAYRYAMPTLSNPENIRDFVACVAHGMLIEAINIKEGTKFLYAAQVAGGVAAKPAPAKPGRPISSSE